MWLSRRWVTRPFFGGAARHAQRTKDFFKPLPCPLVYDHDNYSDASAGHDPSHDAPDGIKGQPSRKLRVNLKPRRISHLNDHSFAADIANPARKHRRTAIDLNICVKVIATGSPAILGSAERMINGAQRTGTIRSRVRLSGGENNGLSVPHAWSNRTRCRVGHIRRVQIPDLDSSSKQLRTRQPDASASWITNCPFLESPSRAFKGTVTR